MPGEGGVGLLRAFEGVWEGGGWSVCVWGRGGTVFVGGRGGGGQCVCLREGQGGDRCWVSVRAYLRGWTHPYLVDLLGAGERG